MKGKTCNLIAKMQRHGLHVERLDSQWSARTGGHQLSIIDQDGEAIAIHVQRLDERADPTTNYYPGSYFPSLVSAMRYIARAKGERA